MGVADSSFTIAGRAPAVAAQEPALAAMAAPWPGRPSCYDRRDSSEALIPDFRKWDLGLALGAHWRF